MFTRSRHRSALVANTILPIAALLEFDSILQGVMLVVTCIALSLVTGEADAETLDDWSDDEEVTYESDRHWYGSNARLIRSSSLVQNGERVALRDGPYQSASSYPLLVQTNQPGSTTGDTGLPTLPPPTDQPPPAIAPEPANGQLPLPPQPNAAATQAPAPANSLSSELKKTEADEKKKEKPAIPDLAKGILIASNDGDLTFKPGLRMTPRYNYETTNGNNDMFIRRFRLKGSGSAYGVAKYGAEIKIDNTGRFEVNPTAIVENAWLDFPVVEDEAYLRAGRFDIPFSRNELTSDSKLLLMDRTLIKEAVTAVGMCDKQYGVMLHGRPNCGRWEYDVGVFDSNVYEKTSPVDTRETDQLMPAARVTYSFLDRPTALDGYADYWASYIGKGQRLDVGFNTAYLGGITDGLRQFNQTALGTDVFFNTGPYTFQAEYDWVLQNQDAGAPDALIHGWYAQFGYLIDYWCEKPCTEFAVRYQTLDSDLLPETLRWTSVGFNFYIREHNLKVQTDYTFKHGDSGTLFTMMQEDVFQVQLQLDF